MNYEPPSYITLDDVYNKFGESAVSMLLCHDGSGEPDQAKVSALIGMASAAADSHLYASFVPSTVKKLSEDLRFKWAICDIFMALAGQQKHEFDGSSDRAPYFHLLKPAKQTLSDLAKGVERMGAEVEHGANPTLRGRVSVSTPVRHVYAASRTNPRGSGGF